VDAVAIPAIVERLHRRLIEAAVFRAVPQRFPSLTVTCLENIVGPFIMQKKLEQRVRTRDRNMRKRERKMSEREGDERASKRETHSPVLVP
jgi:hypothetical protein